MSTFPGQYEVHSGKSLRHRCAHSPQPDSLSLTLFISNLTLAQQLPCQSDASTFCACVQFYLFVSTSILLIVQPPFVQFISSFVSCILRSASIRRDRPPSPYPLPIAHTKPAKNIALYRRHTARSTRQQKRKASALHTDTHSLIHSVHRRRRRS